jgi:hypothetical protein
MWVRASCRGGAWRLCGFPYVYPDFTVPLYSVMSGGGPLILYSSVMSQVEVIFPKSYDYSLTLSESVSLRL